MTKSIKFEVQPQWSDSVSGEVIDLTSYTVIGSGEDYLEYEAQITSANSFVTLPVITGHNGIELVSDQDLTFDIMTAGSVLVVEFTKVKYFNMNLDAANLTYTYKIKNFSGTTANITWRIYI
jgi:hypothetical protein